MHRPFQIIRVGSRLVEECEAHSVMGIGDWESHTVMKQPARRWQEGFAQNHWRNGRSANQTMAIIKGFGAAANCACINALKIPRLLTISVQPLGEVDQHTRYLFGIAIMTERRRSRMDDIW